MSGGLPVSCELPAIDSVGVVSVSLGLLGFLSGSLERALKGAVVYTASVVLQDTVQLSVQNVCQKCAQQMCATMVRENIALRMCAKMCASNLCGGLIFQGARVSFQNANQWQSISKRTPQGNQI